MTNDDFENQLRGTPMRKIPADWRAHIFSAAKQSSQIEAAGVIRKQSWWRELLWPAPQAWAALAFIWLVLLALSFHQSPALDTTAQQTPVKIEDVMMKLAQQRSLAGTRGALGL